MTGRLALFHRRRGDQGDVVVVQVSGDTVLVQQEGEYVVKGAAEVLTGWPHDVGYEPAQARA